MTQVVKRASSPTEIATFLFIAYASSWAVWAIGIKLGSPSERLIFGAAGPALAAAVMKIRQPADRDASPKRFSVAAFVLLIAAAWAAQVLATAARTRMPSLSWDPILLIASVVAAYFAVEFWRLGDIKLEWSRWCSVALLSMPAVLLIPAAIAYFAHLPVVQPRPNESVAMLVGVAAVLFMKEFLFAGLLEESGWRGWLLPRLQGDRPPLVATLLVWLPWALWHAPLDFTGGVGGSLMSYIQVRVVFFLAISLILTWLYNRSGGSLVVVALFHAAFNTFPFVFPYSPPFLALILVWSIWVVIADRMWRSPEAVSSASASGVQGAYEGIPDRIGDDQS